MILYKIEPFDFLYQIGDGIGDGINSKDGQYFELLLVVYDEC